MPGFVNMNFRYRLSSFWGKSVNHFGGDFARFYQVIEIVSVGIFRIYFKRVCKSKFICIKVVIFIMVFSIEV